MSSLIRPTAGRAVHLRVTPRPSNLGESREIMRLVSQFGEIEYFKNLKYDELSAPNTALVIYKDEKAASECLRRSPIRFRMGRAPVKEEENEWFESVKEGSHGEKRDSVAVSAGEDEVPLPRGPVGAPFGLGQPSQARYMSTSSSFRRPSSFHQFTPFEQSSTSTTPAPESRIFQIVTNPSSRSFRDHINVNAYHGYFAVDTKQFGQNDLARRVPTPGLSCMDWKAVEKPWHRVRAEKEWEQRGPKARKRLGELWEQGKRASEEEGFGGEGSRLRPG